ncbi:MAG: GNAT family N-acetyltransferase [Opitutales bacterium]
MNEISQADLSSQRDAEAVVLLLNEYAKDEMGGGEALSEYARAHLIPELKKRPNAVSFVAYVDGEPAGLAICFEAFSTFKCLPILNIHDFTVAPAYRGRGLSKEILREVEKYAIQSGCCKLTLEVLEGNELAQKAYRSFGFSGYELDPKMGKAMFFEKPL